MIQIKQAETQEELAQILLLQQKNHLESLTNEKRKTDGFVTVRHDIKLLSVMNSSARQIIALDDNAVVGYALVMLKEFSELIPVLTPMFDMFKNISFHGRLISDYKFYVMGQICIAESHRGQGIFRQLYQKHKEVYSPQFDICLTEVSVSNPRSMRAHQNAGFQTIHTFKDATDEWNILLWDWQDKSRSH